MDISNPLTSDNLSHWLPFTKELPAEEIGALTEVLQLRHFPTGVVVFTEGDEGDRLYLVVEGEIEIVRFLGTEDERRLSYLRAGDIFGEMSLLIPGRLRTASARTLTPVKLLEMLHSEFEELMLRQPRLGMYVIQEMTARMNNTEQGIIAELQHKNIELVQAYQELKQAQQKLIERERIEHELALAQKIQQGILPAEIPQLPGWRINVHWQPAHAVGGDFYDFIPLPDGKLCLAVGDATGKGIPAALVMATTCSILRAIAASMSTEQVFSPGEILYRANDLLCRQMPAGMFITCLLAVLDTASGELYYANAGHCLPYLIRAEKARELNARGMPLGLLPGMDYEEHLTTLESMDYMAVFSDGLLEAHNPSGDMLGSRRIAQLLVSCSRDANIISDTLSGLAEFTGPGWEQEDDLTLVSIQRIG
jgi:serine phosphatase RsbU (regulator of sigma subunit)